MELLLLSNIIIIINPYGQRYWISISEHPKRDKKLKFLLLSRNITPPSSHYVFHLTKIIFQILTSQYFLVTISKMLTGETYILLPVVPDALHRSKMLNFEQKNMHCQLDLYFLPNHLFV